MVEVRCKHCGRLQMKLEFGVGEIKCGRCKKIIRFKVTTQMLDNFIEKLKARDQAVKKT